MVPIFLNACQILKNVSSLKICRFLKILIFENMQILNIFKTHLFVQIFLNVQIYLLYYFRKNRKKETYVTYMLIWGQRAHSVRIFFPQDTYAYTVTTKQIPA